MPTYILLGSIVSELHGLRMTFLLKAVTPKWVTKTVPFSLEINYIRFCDPFEILQAKFKFVFSAGPGCPVPSTLSKQSAARGKPVSVISIYLT